MMDGKDKEIILLNERLRCAIKEVQVYREYVGQIRRNIKQLNFALTYTPDKDKRLHKAIWGHE
jgi:hypothetical protein